MHKLKTVKATEFFCCNRKMLENGTHDISLKYLLNFPFSNILLHTHRMFRRAEEESSCIRNILCVLSEILANGNSLNLF